MNPRMAVLQTAALPLGYVAEPLMRSIVAQRSALCKPEFDATDPIRYNRNGRYDVLHRCCVRSGIMAKQQVSEQDTLLDPAGFTRYMQQYFTQAGIASSSDSDLNLALALHGTAVPMHLQAAYNDYLRQPATLPTIAATLCHKAARYTPDQLITDWRVLGSAVFPMLKPLSLLMEVHERGLPMLAYRWWQAGLMITYVIREMASVAYINVDHLQCWQISEDELHTRALRNLQLQTTRVAPTLLGHGARQIFLFDTQDGYDAARILLPDVLEMWQAALPGRMLIGIPHRDLLVAFSDQEPAISYALMQQIAQDATTHPAALTEQLFTMRDGVVELYVDGQTDNQQKG